MNNALSKITARAKQLYKKNKSKPWKHWVAVASKEYNIGKLGKAPKQTGKSNLKRDRQRKAKKPGKRVSRSGNRYFERRKNRSDAPGKITGHNVPGQIKAEMEQVHIAEAKLWQLKNTTRAGKSYHELLELVRQKKYWTAYKKIHKANIRNLKRLI